jgi:hypothetical protein
MRLNRTFGAILIALAATFATGAQDRNSGGIKGKVRVEKGSPSGVSVRVHQDEREIATVVTDRNGDFVIAHLPAGIYSVTFRKPGLSVGEIAKVEVRPGKPVSLREGIFLTVDEGSLAFIRGSVFDQNGRSLPNARVEIFRVESDGSVKKLDARITTETGSFAFRLPPDAAFYRLTARAERMQTASKDVKVDGAEIYRIAISLLPEPR